MALIAAIKTLIARSDSNSGIPDFRNFRVFVIPEIPEFFRRKFRKFWKI